MAVAGDRVGSGVRRPVDRRGRRDHHPARLHVRPAARRIPGRNPSRLRPAPPPGRWDAPHRARRRRKETRMIPIRTGRATTLIVALLAVLFPALPATADAADDEERPAGGEAPAQSAPTPADSPPQPEDATGLPPYLADRGRGMATSQFGTYVRKGEWLVYAFYEYTKTSGFEYAPDELGFTGDEEHVGTLTEREGLLFISHGFTDRLAGELEGALHATSSLRKAADDFSAVPDRLEESGLGDVESQLRWRWVE